MYYFKHKSQKRIENTTKISLLGYSIYDLDYFYLIICNVSRLRNMNVGEIHKSSFFRQGGRGGL